MNISGLGQLLRKARETAGISRADLAGRCGVGARLVAELERGDRPNVSLDTAMRLLTAVGIAATFEAPDHSAWRAEDAQAAAEARTAYRRRTWTGRIDQHPAATGAPDVDGTDLADGIARTARLSAEVSALTPAE